MRTLLSLREFARRAGINHNAVRKHIAKGTIKIVKREAYAIPEDQLEVLAKIRTNGRYIVSKESSPSRDTT